MIVDLIRRPSRALPSVVALAALLTLLVAPRPVSAQDKPQVATFVVAADALSRKEATTANYLVRRAAGQLQDVQHISLDDLLEPGDPAAAEQALRQAQQLYVRGKNAYDMLELEQSIELLKECVALNEQAVAYFGRGNLLRLALLHLGAASILLGELDQGMEAFRRALRIDPAVKLDPALFPPSLVELFEQARSEVVAEPKGSVSVFSQPANAATYLDGRFVGITPMAIDSIPVGTHYLRADVDGYRRYGGQVRVVATHDESVTMKLEPTTHLKRFERLLGAARGEIANKTSGAAITKLMAWLGVERLLVGVAKKVGREVTLDLAAFEAAGQRRYASETLSYSPDNAIYQAQVISLASQMLSLVPATPDEGEGEPEPQPLPSPPLMLDEDPMLDEPDPEEFLSEDLLLDGPMPDEFLGDLLTFDAEPTPTADEPQEQGLVPITCMSDRDCTLPALCLDGKCQVPPDDSGSLLSDWRIWAGAGGLVAVVTAVVLLVVLHDGEAEDGNGDDDSTSGSIFLKF